MSELTREQIDTVRVLVQHYDGTAVELFGVSVRTLCDMALRTHVAERRESEYAQEVERLQSLWARAQSDRHRAEAECERLRERNKQLRRVAGLDPGDATPPPETDQDRDEIENGQHPEPIEYAPHTPPEGDTEDECFDYLCEEADSTIATYTPPEGGPENWLAKAVSKAMIQPSRHIQQQSHGDALQWLDTLCAAAKESDDNIDSGGHVVAEAYRVIRHHLNASGEPKCEDCGRSVAGVSHCSIETGGRKRYRCDECVLDLARHNPQQRDPASGPQNSNGDFYGVCPKCERSLEEHVTFYCPDCDTPQAHGDALAASNEVMHDLLYGDALGSVMARMTDELWFRVRDRMEAIIRRHLTASSVPYVPDEVRLLPGDYRERAKTCVESAEKDRSKGDHDIAYDKCHRAELYNGFADRLEAALATPPPKGETQGEASGGWEHEGLPTADDLAASITPHTPNDWGRTDSDDTHTKRNVSRIPEQAGHEKRDSYLSLAGRIIEQRGGDNREQAHGDALAALADMQYASTSRMDVLTEKGSSQRADIIRHRLAASGEPYVPECFKRLTRVASEFCDRVDHGAEDVGTDARPVTVILWELGPAVDECEQALGVKNDE